MCWSRQAATVGEVALGVQAKEHTCKQLPGEGTAGVTALSPNECGLFEKQEEGQCGWRTEEKGECGASRGLRGAEGPHYVGSGCQVKRHKFKLAHLKLFFFFLNLSMVDTEDQMKCTLQGNDISVCSGCYNKIPSTGWGLERDLFLTVPEAGKSKFRTLAHLVSGEHFLVDSCVLTRWKETRELYGVAFKRAPTPFMGAPPS